MWARIQRPELLENRARNLEFMRTESIVLSIYTYVFFQLMYNSNPPPSSPPIYYLCFL